MLSSKINNTLNVYANLIANENMTIVQNADAQTASFNMESRLITLPIYDFVDCNTLRMLTLHELGHAKYTKYELQEFQNLVNEYSGLLNVVEDIYIEQQLARKYPGIISLMKNGYANLEKNNFFSTVGKNIEEYGFVDRINLQFKVGAFVDVKFSREENKCMHSANLYNLNSNEDVVEACKIIKEFLKDGINTKNTENSEFSENSGNNVFDKLENSEDNDFENAENSENTKPNSANENNNSDELSKSLESETMKSFNESLQKHIKDSEKNSHGVAEYNFNTKKYFELVNVSKELKKAIDDNSDFSKNNKVKKTKSLVHNACKSACTIFNMKRDAKKIKEQKHKKSGRINQRKLHSYKTNSNIFKNIAISNKETNHGVVILIDFSSSITGSINEILIQAAIAAEFCYINGIPFEVILFGVDLYMEYVGGASTKNYYNAQVKIADNLNYSMEQILFVNNLHTKNRRRLVSFHMRHSCTPLLDGLCAVVETFKKYKAAGVEKNHLLIISDGAPTSGNTVPEYISKNGKVISDPRNEVMGSEYNVSVNSIQFHYDVKDTFLDTTTFKYSVNEYIGSIATIEYMKAVYNISVTYSYVTGSSSVVRDYISAPMTYKYSNQNDKRNKAEAIELVKQYERSGFIQYNNDGVFDDIIVLNNESLSNIATKSSNYENIVRSNIILKLFAKKLAEAIA